jgi:molybdate transport system substrate-binding protein
VLAAASLAEVLDDVASDFERAHPRVAVRASYAGSQTVVMQVLEGIDADVVATASPDHMARLERESLIEAPLPLATNRLVWIVRRGLRGAPLAEGSDVRTLVLAAPEVPAGAYARAALERAGLLERAERAVVSLELDVKGVVSKVLFGAADAGLVYATDVTRELRARVRTLELPPAARVEAHYRVAILRDTSSPELAHAFVARLRGPAGRAALERFGFGAPQ